MVVPVNISSLSSPSCAFISLVSLFVWVLLGVCYPSFCVYFQAINLRDFLNVRHDGLIILVCERYTLSCYFWVGVFHELDFIL